MAGMSVTSRNVRTGLRAPGAGASSTGDGPENIPMENQFPGVRRARPGGSSFAKGSILPLRDQQAVSHQLFLVQPFESQAAEKCGHHEAWTCQGQHGVKPQIAML